MTAPKWQKAVEIPTVDFSEPLGEGGFMRWPVPTMNQPALALDRRARQTHNIDRAAMLEPRPGVYVYDMGQNE